MASVPHFDTKHFFGLSKGEYSLLKKLRTGARVQDFLDTIPVNFEKNGETYASVQRVLQHRKAHCTEGAILAACAFWISGQEPLLLDFKTYRDESHVVALFREENRWGAVSKTNHSVLRYRDPVYKTIRELVLSYFHEYFRKDGSKSLCSYSRPFSLLRYDPRRWISGAEELFFIPEDIDASPHSEIVPRQTLTRLRKADPIVRRVSDITEWGRSGKKRKTRRQ